MPSLDADPTKTPQEILEDVVSVSRTQTHMPGLVLGPFAALLVRLSQDASVTADKNLLIQRRIIRLTYIILFISIAQLFLGFLQFSATSPHNAQPAVVASKSVQAAAGKKDEKPDHKTIQSEQAPLPKK